MAAGLTDPTTKQCRLPTGSPAPAPLTPHGPVAKPKVQGPWAVGLQPARFRPWAPCQLRLRPDLSRFHEPYERVVRKVVDRDP